MKRPKYFTPNEVSVHNTSKDIWVSFLGRVYDLTPLVEEHAGMCSHQCIPSYISCVHLKSLF
jgi:hypothetical protein